MRHHATLTCQACRAEFPSAMPLTRSGVLASSLMFLVEQCPTCGDQSAYLRREYRVEVTPLRLSA